MWLAMHLTFVSTARFAEKLLFNVICCDLLFSGYALVFKTLNDKQQFIGKWLHIDDCQQWTVLSVCLLFLFSS